MQTTRTSFWFALGTALALGACSMLTSCEDARAAATKLTTNNAQVAAPTAAINLGGSAAAAGSSLSFLGAGAVFSVSAPVCSVGSHLTSLTGTSLVCSADSGGTISVNSSLIGNGIGASPLGLALNHNNTWSVAQTFSTSTANQGLICNSTGSGTCIEVNATTSGAGIVASNAGAGAWPIVASSGAGAQKSAVWTSGDGAKGPIHMDPGSTPSNPDNGDFWVTNTTANVRAGGVNYQIAPPVANSWPTRRTAPDASDTLVWTMDQASLPMTNSGAAGSNGNLDASVGGADVAYGRLGFFANALLATSAGTRVAVYGSASGGIEPALPVTMSAWVWPTVTPSQINGEIVAKKAQANGTWTGEVTAISCGFSSANGVVSAGVGVANILRTCTGSSPTVDRVTPGAWNHIGCTYDGVNLKTYVNGNLTTTCPTTGAIDYQAHGPWYVSPHNDNSAIAAPFIGYIDDVRVATVDRGAAWFSAVWTTATGFGGN